MLHAYSECKTTSHLIRLAGLNGCCFWGFFLLFKRCSFFKEKKRKKDLFCEYNNSIHYIIFISAIPIVEFIPAILGFYFCFMVLGQRQTFRSWKSNFHFIVGYRTFDQNIISNQKVTSLENSSWSSNFKSYIPCTLLWIRSYIYIYIYICIRIFFKKRYY